MGRAGAETGAADGAVADTGTVGDAETVTDAGTVGDAETITDKEAVGRWFTADQPAADGYPHADSHGSGHAGDAIAEPHHRGNGDLHPHPYKNPQ